MKTDSTKTPSEILLALQQQATRRVCGIMSGTSLDAIDVAIVRIHGCGVETKFALEAFEEIAFTDEVRELIRRNSDERTSSVKEICQLDMLLAHLYADAVRATTAQHGISADEIALIGLHGQTIHHLPESETFFGYPLRSTMQIGSGAALAAMLSVPVVSDFRIADMALGGQGAPLIPYFDYLFFRSETNDRILLNVGGIANVTILPKKCDANDVNAFDVGPGNMVIDALTRHYFAESFDRDGKHASQGTVHERFLSRLLEHEFITKPYPKSTGREMFGETFVRKFIETGEREYHLTPEDMLATATEFTAACIAKGCVCALPDPVSLEVIVSGGGLKNFFLMTVLKKYFSSDSISPIEAHGIPSSAKEALCFAVLANAWLHGNRTNMPSATGARKQTLLGSLSIG